MDYIYDSETYPNVYLLTVKPVGGDPVCFEISDRRNDCAAITAYCSAIRATGGRMVGFNNIGFDYPLLHAILRQGSATAAALYQMAQSIIESQDSDNRWAHDVKPSDRLVEQIDLFRIHHFDNVARATSLKVIEFNLRRAKVADLPFPVGSILSPEQIDVLRAYNLDDVEATEAFYHESLPMIRFREELTARYQRDFMNHNDTKIGKDYFVMMLEQSGVACYDYTPDKGRTPRQTVRRQIALRDAILPDIRFQHPEFQRVLDYLRAQVITETKGVFKELVAAVNGFDFVFGTGGIHGSVENMHVESDTHWQIVDLDVASYYPNLAIVNGFHPEHLGASFTAIYRNLYEQRKHYPKGSAENAMLKLALNGVYGDSNNKFSVFYDPMFTMQITLNGQLLMCVLAEQLMRTGCRMIQINTDGCTVMVPMGTTIAPVCEWWENFTGLTLERTDYRRMWVADVNSYVAERTDGIVKRKGRYEYDREWHQDQSALVVPKVAEKVLLHGAPIRETVENWSDPWDFLLRVRVPRAGRLSITMGGVDYALPNTTRYYVAKGGGQLTKWLPPIKTLPKWRQFAIEAGWGVQVCNDLSVSQALLPIDFDYYVREIEKLVLPLI
jgi:hypothetical protein